jgi:hypothetical protein
VFGAIVWQEFWDVVAGMQGLKVLNVFITLIGPYFVKTNMVEDLLKPMQAVKNCDEFSVELGPIIPALPLIARPYRLRILNTGGDGLVLIPHE